MKERGKTRRTNSFVKILLERISTLIRLSDNSDRQSSPLGLAPLARRFRPWPRQQQRRRRLGRRQRARSSPLLLSLSPSLLAWVKSKVESQFSFLRTRKRWKCFLTSKTRPNQSSADLRFLHVVSNRHSCYFIIIIVMTCLPVLSVSPKLAKSDLSCSHAVSWWRNSCSPRWTCCFQRWCSGRYWPCLSCSWWWQGHQKLSSFAINRKETCLPSWVQQVSIIIQP